MRTWRALDSKKIDPRDLEAHGPAAVAQRDAATLAGAPIYSTVSGSLPLADLSRITLGNRSLSFVEFTAEAPVAGGMRLKIEDPTGLELWVDGARVDTAPELTLALAAGEHRFLLAIDRNARQTPLRIELVNR